MFWFACCTPDDETQPVVVDIDATEVPAFPYPTKFASKCEGGSEDVYFQKPKQLMGDTAITAFPVLSAPRSPRPTLLTSVPQDVEVSKPARFRDTDSTLLVHPVLSDPLAMNPTLPPPKPLRKPRSVQNGELKQLAAIAEETLGPVSIDRQELNYPSPWDRTSCGQHSDVAPTMGGSFGVQSFCKSLDQLGGAGLAAETDQPTDFATSAARGRRCVLFSESTAARAEAVYCVDEQLGELRVISFDQTGQQEVVACPIASIADIYTIDDGEACFPTHIVDSVLVDEKARMFLIEYAADETSNEFATLYLVEASQSARDELLQHLLLLLNASSHA
mmetsp:Transcript_66089/g.166646  ORF Transcript_66089/g.166646 Transcript_66089/m.166646 type:complete len:333 (-) Transcript_66089:121-1119(-)